MKAPTPQLLRLLRRSLSSSSPPYRPAQHLRHCPSSQTDQHPHPHRYSTHAPSPSRSRGPRSSETTQTDFHSMDVLVHTPPPSTSIDACVSDGFHLDNGVKITGGDGVMLVAGEVFAWKPWEDGAGGGSGGGKMGMINKKGQWEVGDEGWGVLELVWPKPDLLILGLGASIYPLSEATRRRINSLGVRVDIQDTRNAAAQFNLLATERGVSSIAAALLPIGWKWTK